MVRRITYPLGWVGCSLQIITNFVIWPTWPCALNPIENHCECWRVKGLICGHKLVWKKQCSMTLLAKKNVWLLVMKHRPHCVSGLYVMTSNKIFSNPSLRLCQYIVMNSCLLCYLFIRVDFCQPLLPLAFWLHWAWPHMMERIRIKEWVRKSRLQTLIIVVQ